jgi:hypothetical protein
MPDTEILNKILLELKEINNTVQDLYSSMEAQNEMVMNKLTALETIVEKSNTILNTIETNTQS